MGKLIMVNGSYKNTDVVENLIIYITRARRAETRGDNLKCYGGAGIGEYLQPEAIVQQILYTQDLFGIQVRKGRRM